MDNATRNAGEMIRKQGLSPPYNRQPAPAGQAIIPIGSYRSISLLLCSYPSSTPYTCRYEYSLSSATTNRRHHPMGNSIGAVVERAVEGELPPDPERSRDPEGGNRLVLEVAQHLVDSTGAAIREWLSRKVSCVARRSPTPASRSRSGRRRDARPHQSTLWAIARDEASR